MDPNDISPTSDTFDGPLLGGRYQLGPLLGRGGQGSTHLALDLQTGTHVAIKAFDLSKAASWKDLELFRREGEALRALDHPGIPRHMGELESDGGQAYLVMEYVPGRSLKEQLRQQGLFDEASLRRVLERGLEILAYLETRLPAVVHRDLKPSNLIERPDGGLALVDFGGVKLRARPDGGSTVVGTLGYMAPEQLYGEAMPATDLYGLGATLVALGTGREPEDLPRKGLSIHVDAVLPQVSPALRQVLKRLTAPDPDDRPRSAAGLLAELRQGPAQPAAEGEVLIGQDWRSQLPAWGRAHWMGRWRPRPWRALPLIFLVMLFGWGIPGGFGFFGLLALILPIMLAIWFFTTAARVRRFFRQQGQRVIDVGEEQPRPPSAPPWMMHRETRRERRVRHVELQEPPEARRAQPFEQAHGRGRR